MMGWLLGIGLLTLLIMRMWALYAIELKDYAKGTNKYALKEADLKECKDCNNCTHCSCINMSEDNK